MSASIYFFLGAVALLGLLVVWALRGPRKTGKVALDLSCLEESGWRHATLYPSIRQALGTADMKFLTSHSSKELAGRVRAERRQIALSYLRFLRSDFDKFVEIARVIARLSPEVAATQELERAWLRAGFLWRYRIIWLSLQAGFAPLPQLNDLSSLLSGYSVRLEEAMRQLGERAALIAEVTSAPDRRRINPI